MAHNPEHKTPDTAERSDDTPVTPVTPVASGTYGTSGRQIPGVPVGPPSTQPDVDQETHEAIQMKVAMKMVGSAMVFIGFIQVFMSASTGAEITIFPMILYFAGLALWAHSSITIAMFRYAVILFSIICAAGFIHLGEVLFWHKYVLYWGTIAMVVYFMFQTPKKPK